MTVTTGDISSSTGSVTSGSSMSYPPLSRVQARTYSMSSPRIVNPRADIIELQSPVETGKSDEDVIYLRSENGAPTISGPGTIVSQPERVAAPMFPSEDANVGVDSSTQMAPMSVQVAKSDADVIYLRSENGAPTMSGSGTLFTQPESAAAPMFPTEDANVGVDSSTPMAPMSVQVAKSDADIVDLRSENGASPMSGSVVPLTIIYICL